MCIAFYVIGYALQGDSHALRIVAGLSGLLFFSVLCIIRFTDDDVEKVWGTLQRHRAETIIMRQEAEIDQLIRENRRLANQARTHEFKEASKNARAVAVSDDEQAQLRRDVAKIVDLWAKGMKHGRDHCGISRGRWGVATQFLVHCGVMEIANDSTQRRSFVDGLTAAQADRRIRDAYAKIDKHDGTNFTPSLS